MDGIFSVDLDRVRLLSKINAFDYIIVGSGMGGGPLAEILSHREKRVLLIERGHPVFSTHVLNTSRPYFKRGASNSPEGNETIYDRVKARVQLTEGSTPYVGGPVYCVGGRSNLWGIWTPEVDRTTLDEYFPEEIARYLKDEDGYKKTFNFMTDNSQTDDTYPRGSGQISSQDLDDVKALLESALEGTDFDLMPVAAQFNSPLPYKFPQGAYSTTLALMNRMYANDRFLTVLLGTEVLSFDQKQGTTLEENRKVSSLLVQDTKTKEIQSLDVGNAEVILCAGTLGTSMIALRSGLQSTHPLVGKGLIDHDVCYVRFGKYKSEGITVKPVNMKTIMKIGGETCLVTVTVNANFFLAGSSAALPMTHFYTGHKVFTSPKSGFFSDIDDTETDTICVLFEYVGKLNNNNEVLNTSSLDPVIHIVRPPLAPEIEDEMAEICGKIRDLFLYQGVSSDYKVPPPPRPQQLGFGVFSHECGTMRMDGPKSDGVVDKDLRVKNFSNLSVCDLSVMPVSTEANPSLTLASLSIRMADKFAPPPPRRARPPFDAIPPGFTQPPTVT